MAIIPTLFEYEPIGYLTSGEPVWPVLGAEGDDDDDDDGNIDPTGGGSGGDDDDDDDDDDDKGGKDGKKGDDKNKKYEPPSEDEWKRTQAALTRANTEAKRHRLKAKELSKPKEGEDEKVKQAAEDAEKRFKPVAIRSAAKAGFLEAGLNDASPERVKKLLRLIDMDDVDVDDDGDVVGLDTQIDGIKADYPELFRPADGQRKRAPKLDASGKPRGGDNGKAKSIGEKIAADLGV